MKVTFAVHDHSLNEITLVKSEVKGNRPKEKAWEEAAVSAKKKVSESKGREWDDWYGGLINPFTVAYVLKGWVDLEDRAPFFIDEEV